MITGVSPATKAMFADAARAKGGAGWLVTLQQPSVNAILAFAGDRDLRARVYRASGTRASDQGADAGRFDNGGRIDRMLHLRRKAAALLGFTDPVAWSLAAKIASNADEVLAFLRDLARRAKPAGERELAEIKAFATERLGIADLQPWDVAFVSNLLRRERFAIDEQAVRAYSPVNQRMKEWLALLARLFHPMASRTKIPDSHQWTAASRTHGVEIAFPQRDRARRVNLPQVRA